MRPFCLILAALLLAEPAAAEPVDVAAAASLGPALGQVAAAWTAATGQPVRVQAGASPRQAQQIRQGAPADIFVSAAPEWMDVLAREGLIDAASRRDLLGNRLVLIAADPQAAPVEAAPGLDLAGMLGDGRLAMAMVGSVPAGVYGRQALTALGLWDGVADRLVQAENVRAALGLVASGEAPLGIVYASDAQAEPRVRVIATFPESSHAPIRYPAAITTEGAGRPETRAFFAALDGTDARRIFAAAGFIPPGPPPVPKAPQP